MTTTQPQQDDTSRRERRVQTRNQRQHTSHAPVVGRMTRSMLPAPAAPAARAASEQPSTSADPTSRARNNNHRRNTRSSSSSGCSPRAGRGAPSSSSSGERAAAAAAAAATLDFPESAAEAWLANAEKEMFQEKREKWDFDFEEGRPDTHHRHLQQQGGAGGVRAPKWEWQQHGGSKKPKPNTPPPSPPPPCRSPDVSPRTPRPDRLLSPRVRQH
ncbi:hypothetical protein RI054_08g43860 [Pseudoscourfieldia marina]